MQVVLLFESTLKSGNMGASKHLSNDLKTKIVQHYGLGEGYKKLSQRFQLSVSIVRNIMRKWKTTDTVLVKARSGRPRKISERQRRRMVRTVKDNPQTTSKDLQHHLAADGVTASFNNSAYFAQGEAVRENDAAEAFSAHTPQTESLEVCKSTFGQASFIGLWTDKTKIELFGHNKGR